MQSVLLALEAPNDKDKQKKFQTETEETSTVVYTILKAGIPKFIDTFFTYVKEPLACGRAKNV